MLSLELTAAFWVTQFVRASSQSWMMLYGALIIELYANGFINEGGLGGVVLTLC